LQEKDEWPSWLLLQFNLASALSSDKEYLHLLTLWVEIEHTQKYAKKSTSLLPTKHCPPAVQAWIKSARGERERAPKLPEIGPLPAYSKSWLDWWSMAQPNWHKRDEDGRLIMGGSGSWSVLKVGGINSIISFVMSLGWWGHKLTSSNDSPASDAWHAEITDMTWVL
ncbi:hypothetical protein BS47DRAFT_1277967, partial [Hydnum rufescens UP504]